MDSLTSLKGGLETFQALKKTLSGTPSKKPSTTSSPIPPPPLEPSSNPRLGQLLEDHKVVDLTQKLWEEAQIGKRSLHTPFCIGRDKKLMQMALRLSCTKDRCSVFLTGPTGVGKTTLIVELARLILTCKKTYHLAGYHLFEMPNKMVDVNFLKEISASVNGKAIFVWDECHQVFDHISVDFKLGEGLDNILSVKQYVERLKPYLASGEIRLLGISDRGNYWRQDPALARRFEVISLGELGVEECEAIVAVSPLEADLSKAFFREVHFTKGAVRTAIYLSMAFDEDRFLPEKLSDYLEIPARWWLAQEPEEAEITPEVLINYMVKVKGKSRLAVQEALDDQEAAYSCPIPSQDPLAKYTSNLSLKARRGKLNPAWGREKLLEDIATILNSAESNNVLLIGPPGSGKTRLIEGLAWAVEQGKIPQLRGKDILLLNVAKAKPHLAEVIESAIKYSGDYILVIDEVHRLSAAAPGDFAPMLSSLSSPMGLINNIGQMAGRALSSPLEDFKEPLGRGLIPLLALTTEAESHGIRSDPALARRFAPPKRIPLLSKNETMEILTKEIDLILKKFEAKGRPIKSVEEGALLSAYYLSHVYLKAEYQPGASLKMLNLACSYASRHKRVLNLQACLHAASNLSGESTEEVEKKLEEERQADCIASTRIPSGEALVRFSDDWTREARLGRIPLLKGRENTLVHIQQTLLKLSCNNVLLIGDAGVGKTTLVQQLALAMAEGRVHPDLQNKPLLSLRLSDLEKNPNNLSEFIQSVNRYAGEFVLFIDEIHPLFPSGIEELPLIGSFSATKTMEQLKPLLAEGKITLIGATTPEDFRSRRLTEALRRRFEILTLKAPCQEEAKAMIEARLPEIIEGFAKKGIQVEIQEETISEAVLRAEAKKLPASALSLLEEAVTRKALGQQASPASSDKGKEKADDPLVIEPCDILPPNNPYSVNQQTATIFDVYNVASSLLGGGAAPSPSSPSIPWWLSVFRFFMNLFRFGRD